MKIESVPMEFLTDSQVSYDHRSYARNLSNCIQKPEKVRTSIYFIYHFTLTDSVRLIHVWKVVCGHSLPFDVFFGTMTGDATAVELSQNTLITFPPHAEERKTLKLQQDCF